MMVAQYWLRPRFVARRRGEPATPIPSPAGLRAAVAAGVPAVGITTGQPRDVLAAAGACVLIDDFHQLLGMARAHERGEFGGDRKAVAAAAAALDARA